MSAITFDALKSALLDTAKEGFADIVGEVKEKLEEELGQIAADAAEAALQGRLDLLDALKDQAVLVGELGRILARKKAVERGKSLLKTAFSLAVKLVALV